MATGGRERHVADQGERKRAEIAGERRASTPSRYGVRRR